MAQASRIPILGHIFKSSPTHNRREATSKSEKSKSNSVDFFGSQIGDQSVISYSYTDRPLVLLAWDIYYFFRFSWAIPYIIWPWNPYDSGDMSELAPTWGNFWSIFIHVILVFLQLAFILFFPPVALFLPVWVTLCGVVLFLTVNRALCQLINGKDEVFYSDPEYARHGQEKFAHEQWIFLNGVAAGEHWMKSNLNRLALTFGRPIIGIHNKTDGILFDVIECLVQRNLTYATEDVRICYRIIKAKLYNPQYSKVVFILHSQGAIEGGLVLDWLLQELPQNLLCKLEVYTFGNAANHFNNPYRTIGSQDQAERHPLEASLDAVRTTSDQRTFDKPEAWNTDGKAVQTHGEASKTDNEARGTPHPLSDHGHRPPTPASTPPLRTKTNTNTNARDPQQSNDPAGEQTPESPIHALARASTSIPDPPTRSERAIGHIEHYAHTTDFVALWGVLHFATSTAADRSMPRFMGRLFSRSAADGRGGHQFVQHYLDGMFPLQRDTVTGRFVGCRESGNEFMESEVVVGKDGDEGSTVREALASSYLGSLEDELEDGEVRRRVRGEAAAGAGGRGGGVAMHNGESPIALRGRLGLPVGKVQVKELSRLWKYRNGKSPVEKPWRGPDGFVREVTLVSK
ncbi:hypothetical protein SLS53_002615 [Cytospora paraplurivora]|uniref:Uncharacterized protein n=1 Tax=Cytospora paraplurivora TaxID=2898453 RepID=A0AAN9YIZ7_9PEZI